MKLRFPKPERRATRKARQKRELQALRASVRRDVFIRDTCCRVCQERPPEHLHHIVFRSAGGDDSTHNCVGVCAACHADLHARKFDMVPAPTNKSLGANGPLEIQHRADFTKHETS